jgi:hypothetical protein
MPFRAVYLTSMTLETSLTCSEGSILLPPPSNPSYITDGDYPRSGMTVASKTVFTGCGSNINNQ